MVTDQGPFDGVPASDDFSLIAFQVMAMRQVWGFSQGATMVALMCARMGCPFRFAVLFAGFYPRDPDIAAWWLDHHPALCMLACCEQSYCAEDVMFSLH